MAQHSPVFLEQHIVNIILCHIFDTPCLDNCQNYDLLCFKQIHELLGLEKDHRYSKAANIQE